RLVIPVPDPKDHSPELQTYWAQWAPEKQAKCLKILQVKTADEEGLALTVPWGTKQRERFRNRMSTAAALAVQKRTPDAPYYVDPFGMTRELLRDEFSPALPKGVAKAWTVAAYTSGAAFAEDANSIPHGPDLRLMAKIRQRFLTPVGPDPEQKLLTQAAALA